jgi:hypothetical protein
VRLQAALDVLVSLEDIDAAPEERVNLLMDRVLGGGAAT